jgi:3,4-dihydroxy 2-butanone 4-phosphate synthase/GTP cyclohydrolase II
MTRRTLTSVPTPDIHSHERDTVASALAELDAGRMVLVVDDEDRENEGDLICAAETATPEALAFMIRHTTGLVCVALPDEWADALDLPLMVAHGDDPNGTAFTVTVDLKGATTTGVSAADRAATIRALADPDTRPGDLSRPGHILPLRARPGGVLERRGHTEAASDLCRLAGLAPIGVLCEITNDDGTMARGPELRRFADEHELVTISVADLVDHRRRTVTTVVRTTSARIPTRHGQFTAVAYRSADPSSGTTEEHVALVMGDIARSSQPVLTRVHSECFTGDIVASQRCDCGDQLDMALARIADEGRGVVVYLRGQEGRGIGLTAKLAAYALQDQGLDTAEANLALGLPVDARCYADAAAILADLGVSAIRLLTNNPDKHRQLKAAGVQVDRCEPIVTEVHPEAAPYLATKRDRMNHVLPEPVPAALEHVG